MGYSASQTAQQFYLAAADKHPAFVAARSMHGRWVHEGDTDACLTLEEVLDYWGFETTLDAEGSIVDIQFVREKLGDELKMFRAIAPWVRDGSFIEMVGEDGAQWRWVFEGGQCAERYPTVTW